MKRNQVKNRDKDDYFKFFDVIEDRRMEIEKIKARRAKDDYFRFFELFEKRYSAKIELNRQKIYYDRYSEEMWELAKKYDEGHPLYETFRKHIKEKPSGRWPEWETGEQASS